MALRFTDYPDHVNQIMRAALAAADPAAAVAAHLRFNGRSLAIGRESIIHTHYPADGRIFLVSVGKAAVPMALAAMKSIGDQITAGVIVTKQGERDWRSELDGTLLAERATEFALYEAGHPVSNEVSVQAATAVANLLAETTAHDLVLCLISGGASALLTQPVIELQAWQQLNAALLASGCTIQELNCVRRQLDRVKGGGLAQWAAPATCVGLILSDVVGNPLHVIGSGLTVRSTETLSQAVSVLARYQVGRRLETAVWQQIIQALHQVKNQPAPPEIRTHNLIIGDARQAARAVMVKAVQLGFVPHLLTAQLEGEAREVGRVAAAIARDTLPGHCYVLAGETTVTLRGPGKGGRNQEMALAAALALQGAPRRVVACFATDGEDGPTPAAGAMITGESVANGRSRRLDPLPFLARNDSHTYFQELERVTGTPHLLQTGPTGTNVNDLLIILSYPIE